MWAPTISSDELYHYGILGMKWGVRRYQNPDGSYTAAGRDRYRMIENDTAREKIVNKYRNKMSRTSSQEKRSKLLQKRDKKLERHDRKIDASIRRGEKIVKKYGSIDKAQKVINSTTAVALISLGADFTATLIDISLDTIKTPTERTVDFITTMAVNTSARLVIRASNDFENYKKEKR